MATKDDTARQPFKYDQLPWGDLIYGTKQELQALGLGIGLAFPGEPGGPKRALLVRDPRGFKTRIGVAWDGVTHSASIPLPGRSLGPKDAWTDVAIGVRKEEAPYCDTYIGTPEALAAAGLVRADQLPGQPGMRKVRVTIFPDGTLPTGAPTANHRESRHPGGKRIERVTKTTYRVRVAVPSDETERRHKASHDAMREWERRMNALPRPSPLTAEFRLRPAASARSRSLPAGWAVVQSSGQHPAQALSTTQRPTLRVIDGWLRP